MARSRMWQRRRRSAFTLIELVIVLVILGVIAGMAIPKLNLSAYRADAAAQQVRSVFMTAQRTSLTRQYDVVVSVDTVGFGLRIAEDKNNDGVIEPGEITYWRPEGGGNTFSIPPKGLNTPTVSASVIGSAIANISGMPSITFHRDGSTSSDAEVYVQSVDHSRTDYRAIALTRATGRTELYRLSGAGTGATWQVVR